MRIVEVLKRIRVFIDDRWNESIISFLIQRCIPVMYIGLADFDLKTIHITSDFDAVYTQRLEKYHGRVEAVVHSMSCRAEINVSEDAANSPAFKLEPVSAFSRALSKGNYSDHCQFPFPPVCSIDCS